MDPALIQYGSFEIFHNRTNYKDLNQQKQYQQRHKNSAYNTMMIDKMDCSKTFRTNGNPPSSSALLS